MNLPHRTVSFFGLAATLLLASAVHAQNIRDGVIYYPGGFTMEVGEPGMLPPPVRAAEGRVLHDDVTGGANQTLQALSGGQSGYCAVWSDTRDGNLGLYFGQLALGGEAATDGIPLHAPRSSRQLLPDLAQFPLGARDSAGAVVWTAQEMNGTFATMRLFDRSVAGEDIFTSSPLGLGALDKITASQLRVLPNGLGVVAWLRAGAVVGRSLTRDTTTGTMRPGRERTLATNVGATDGRFHLAVEGMGGTLIAWTEEGTIRLHFSDLGEVNDASPTVDLGPGKVLEVCHDSSTESPSWWILAQTETALALLHVDGAGVRDRTPIELAQGMVASADLCTWADGKGIAVVVEELRENTMLAPQRSRAGSIRLHILDSIGTLVTPAQGFDALDPEALDARGPKIAATGVNFLVAWTDSRRDSADVYYRHISLADPFQSAQCWNGDLASSDQTHAAVAASGATAVAVWEDSRNGDAQIMARTIQVGAGTNASRRADANAARKLLLGEEIEAEFNGSRCAFPSVAIADDKSFVLVWKEMLETDFILRSQAFDSAGKTLGPAVDLDPGFAAHGTWPAAVVPLPRNAGYMLLWTRTDAGPIAMRLDKAGRPSARAHQLSDRPSASAARPDLCLLDDGRLIAVWDEHGMPLPQKGARKKAAKPIEKVRVLSGRFLDANGLSLGPKLSFAASPSGGDLDATVAPLRSTGSAQPGAFLLVWTGNDGPVRDVFARAMNAKAKPAGPPMAISVKANEQDYAEVVRMPNGELYIAWEDDISGRDHCFLRRVSANGKALGPLMLINETETSYVEDRHAAMLAPLVTPGGPGLLAIWDDLARGKGHDVFGKWIAQEEKPLTQKVNR